MVLSPVSLLKALAATSLLLSVSVNAGNLRDPMHHRNLAAAKKPPAPFPFIAAEAPDYNNQVIGAMLRQSMHLRKPRDGYAVFSWDDTLAAGDLVRSTLLYQAETVNYRIPPTMFYRIFAFGYLTPQDQLAQDECMPNSVHTPLPGGDGFTLNDLLAMLSTDYYHIYMHYLSHVYGAFDPQASPPREFMPLDVLRTQDFYKNFKSKAIFWIDVVQRIATGVNAECTKKFATTWQAMLFNGLTEPELRELTRQSINWNLGKELGFQEQPIADWPRVGGNWATGLRVYNGQVAMMRALRMHHVSVYVITDTMEILVQEAAAMKALAYRVPKNQVFGVRYQFDGNGRLTDQLVNDLPYPSGDGKRQIMEAVLMPKHGGRPPLFASGAKPTDCEMLGTVSTSGIVHVVNTIESRDTCIQVFRDKACQLYNQQEAGSMNRYLLQGVHKPWGAWVKSGFSTNDGQTFEAGSIENNQCSVYDFKM